MDFSVFVFDFFLHQSSKEIKISRRTSGKSKVKSHYTVPYKLLMVVL